MPSATDAVGTVDQGNGQNGLRIFAYANSTFNVGSTTPADKNVISGNNSDGIAIVTASNISNANTQISIINNNIGTNDIGSAKLGNARQWHQLYRGEYRISAHHRWSAIYFAQSYFRKRPERNLHSLEQTAAVWQLHRPGLLSATTVWAIRWMESGLTAMSMPPLAALLMEMAPPLTAEM